MPLCVMLREIFALKAAVMKKKNLLFLALPIIAIVLESLPFGVVLNFDNPDGAPWRQMFSHFDLLPFGYAHFSPPITALLTCVLTILTTVYVLKESKGLYRSMQTFTVAAFLMSLSPLLLGENYVTVIGLCISVILLLNGIVLFFCKGKILFKKKQNILFVITAAVLVCSLSFCIWHLTPKVFLKNIHADDVASISVFDGAAGTRITITNANDIKTIVENIQSIAMRKDNFCGNDDGFGFSLTFQNTENEVIDHLILNSTSTIRDNPFYYRCDDELCYNYLKELTQVH